MTTVNIPYVPLQSSTREPHLSDFANEMSLRDYFAGNIAVGMCSATGTYGAGYGPGEIAQRSYYIADAMLAERAKATS